MTHSSIKAISFNPLLCRLYNPSGSSLHSVSGDIKGQKRKLIDNTSEQLLVMLPPPQGKWRLIRHWK